MLIDIINKNINSNSRNKFSNLEKIILSNSELLNEYKKISIDGFSFTQNIYNILYNIREYKCEICKINNTNWNNKKFCYRKTCNYKCSGKSNKKCDKKYKFPEIKSKSEFIKYLDSNKIKTTSIKNTIFYKDVTSISGNSIQEKVYKWIHNIKNDIICKNENCSNKVKFINYSIGYRDFCSIKCSSSSNIKISKIKNTCLVKYNVSNVSKRNLHIPKYTKILSDFEIISYDNSSFKLKHIKCNEIIEMTRRMIYDRFNLNTEICTNCNNISTMKSGYETQIVNWIKSLNIDIIENDRKTIHPKEIDILIPNSKLAIEFNGLYWHSENQVGKNYHINKTNSCQENEIQLIHIWEDDWVYKQNIIKSILLNKLNIIPNKIFARKCEIKIINDNKLVKDFLNKNHIQGFCKSQLKIGLFYRDKLVSLMTFGFRKTNSKKEFELIRFCNILNTSIIGGASKLFNFFLKISKVNNIVSYADISIFNGNLYKNIGFKFKHRTQPNYYWVVDGVRNHRWKYNKQNLIKLGYDSKKTEKEIMESIGNYRIFSCGQERYEYNR